MGFVYACSIRNLKEIRMSDADLNLPPLIDDEVITELRNIMEEEFADLLHAFLNDLSIQIALMQTAVAQNNADELYQLAHKLKSSCGSLGALRLAELIQRLEQAGRLNTLHDATELLRQTRIVADETVAGLQARMV